MKTPEERAWDLWHAELGERTEFVMRAAVMFAEAMADARRAALEERLKVDVEAVLATLTDDERKELFSNYCGGCGTADLPCHCRNDE